MNFTCSLDFGLQHSSPFGFDEASIIAKEKILITLDFAF